MEEATLTGREERRRRWQEHVEGQRQSGLSVTAYCAANSLKPYQLWYWRRVLRERPSEERAGFVEVVSGGCDGSAITILVGQAQIRVRDGFNPSLLRQVIDSLKQP